MGSTPTALESALRNRALDVADEGIVIADIRQPDGPLIFVNQGFERLTGYAAAEVLGRNCRFLQGPATDPATAAEISAAVRLRRSSVVEILNYRKDGSTFWNRLSITPVRDSSGEVSHYIGVQSNVTARRAAEDALRAANAALEAANRHIRRGLEAAARIQRSLLPATLPDTAGFKFAYGFRPSEALAGDGLNVVRLDEDRVGLYVLVGDGSLRVLHDFTSDATSLVRAVSSLRGNVSMALAGEEDAARLEAELRDLFEDSRLTEMGQHFQGLRAVATIDALESIGRHLSGARNRKNLIWVSAGFPLGAFGYRGRSRTREINRATRALNDANVALYTVDARGLIPTLTGVPGNQTFTTLSMVALNQDILQSVAEETGGRAFLNTNDIQGAVRRAADDARMTYVLGYYPTNEVWDGRFHRVEVKVNRPGVEVRHRKGYVAVATQKQASSERSAALQAAVASPIGASGLGLTLRIDPVEGRPSAYRLAVHVEPGGIALEPRGDEWRGALDVIVAQIRADGADARRVDRVDISVPGERLQQFLRDGLRIEHTVTLVPGAERLRVVVRDDRTGAIGAIGVSRQQLEAIVR